MSALKLSARDVWRRHAEIYAMAVKDRLKSSLKNRPLSQKVGAVVSEVVYSGSLLALDIFLPNSTRTRGLVQSAKHVSDEIFDNPFTRAKVEMEQAREIQHINTSLETRLTLSEKRFSVSQIRLDETQAQLEESRALLKTQADQLRRQAEKLRNKSRGLVARERFKVEWNPNIRVQANANYAAKARQRKLSIRKMVRGASTTDKESRPGSSVRSASELPTYVATPVAPDILPGLRKPRGLVPSQRKLPTPPFSPTTSNHSYFPDNEYLTSANRTPQPLHGLPTPAESTFSQLPDVPILISSPIVERGRSADDSDGSIDIDTPPLARAATEPSGPKLPSTPSQPTLESAPSGSPSPMRPQPMMRMRTTSIGIYGASLRPLNWHQPASQP